MKTAIVYATTHGTTQKVVDIINKELKGEATVFNLKKLKRVEISDFEQVIIGGSIHAGCIQRCVKKFCQQNMVSLLQKRVVLFICGMNEKDFPTELKNAYPELLRKHAAYCTAVGGEFLFNRMNFLERFIVKRITGLSQTVSNINEQKVNELVGMVK